MRPLYEWGDTLYFDLWRLAANRHLPRGSFASASLSRPNRRNLMISGGCRKLKDSSTDEVLVGTGAPLGYRLYPTGLRSGAGSAPSPEAYAKQDESDAAEGTGAGERGSRDPARPPIA